MDGRPRHPHPPPPPAVNGLLNEHGLMKPSRPQHGVFLEGTLRSSLRDPRPGADLHQSALSLRAGGMISRPAPPSAQRAPRSMPAILVSHRADWAREEASA